MSIIWLINPKLWMINTIHDKLTTTPNTHNISDQQRCHSQYVWHMLFLKDILEHVLILLKKFNINFVLNIISSLFTTFAATYYLNSLFIFTFNSFFRQGTLERQVEKQDQRPLQGHGQSTSQNGMIDFLINENIRRNHAACSFHDKNIYHKPF